MRLLLDDIEVTFRNGKSVTRAVRGVSLAIPKGTCLALVGESGSGKTTLGRVAAGLQAPTLGNVRWDGTELGTDPSGTERRSSPVQMVFQHPAQSLDPQWRIGRSLREPLRMDRVSRKRADERVKDLMEGVGLAADIAERLPHQISGGQAQRVAIARALVSDPAIVVLDEPTSGLDQTVRVRALSLLASLQQRTGVGYLMITHDISSARQLASTIAVMYQGVIVETGPANRVLDEPYHPYTQRLIAAVPVADPRVAWTGVPDSPSPDPAGSPGGDCPVVSSGCDAHGGGMHEIEPDHFVACTAA